MKRIIRLLGGRPYSNTDVAAIQDHIDALAAQYAPYAPIVVAGGELNSAGTAVSEAIILLMDGDKAVLAKAPASSITLTGNSGVLVQLADSNERAYGNGTVQNAMRTATVTWVPNQPTINVRPSGGYNRYWHQVPTGPRGTIQWTVAPTTAVFDGANGLGIGLWKGWALCNGNNGTPDLRSKYAIGYEAFVTDVGDRVGANEVTLTALQSGVASHTHGVTDPGHSHGFSRQTAQIGNLVANGPNRGFPDGDSTTTVATTGVSIQPATAQPAQQAHENRPDSIVMIPMMKL